MNQTNKIVGYDHSADPARKAYESGVKPSTDTLLQEIERLKELAESSHTDAEYFALQQENNTFRDRSKLLLDVLIMGHLKMRTYAGIYSGDKELTYILNKWNETIQSCLVQDEFSKHLAKKAEERNETL